ncbi:unnamed protein product [Amoebophrya sp. A120]|nr:unnamed protein product [Amoebophrya sp. A120]|eukprot:GSA120T00020128001.1
MLTAGATVPPPTWDATSKIPQDHELLAAVHREKTVSEKLHSKVAEYKHALQDRIQGLDEQIKNAVTELVEESETEIRGIESERIDILKQLTDLQEIRIRLEEAIQRKQKLKQRTETELKSGRNRALKQKRNQDVAAQVLAELRDELGGILRSLAVLKKDDSEIQYDVEKLYRAKEVVDYVLDAKKTQQSIDTELLHARFNFKIVPASSAGEGTSVLVA